MIGVVSTPEKAELIRAHGAEHALLTSEDIPARVKEITGGAMVPVVYDSVGRDTFTTSLDCLQPLRADGELRQRLRARCDRRTSACWRPRARST